MIAPSLVAEAKAIKTDAEIAGFRACHIRDGAALARYFAWLQEQLDNGVVLNESEGADQLEKYRSCVPHFPLHVFADYDDGLCSMLVGN